MISVHRTFRLLVFAITCALTISCQREGVRLVETPRQELEYKESKYWKDGSLFAGRMIKLHSDGAVRSRTDLRAGVPHGVVVEFDENGTQTAEVNFFEGKRHGKNTYWHPDGSLMKEQWYEHGNEVKGRTMHYRMGDRPAKSRSQAQ